MTKKGLYQMEESETQVQWLDDIIEYQTGSVVSRTLMKNEAGSITLFAFDAGQILSEHTVPYKAFLQVIDGEVEITIAGETFQLSGGQIIVLPANKPHSVNAVQKFKMILTLLRSHED
jgi:quercetin dioxygenase-like cupin family protein